MSSESFSVTDQEGKSMAQHLASAERELCSLVTAVHQLFGPEQARHAADNWLEELEQTDWIGEAQAVDWRALTIAAVARLVGCHIEGPSLVASLGTPTLKRIRRNNATERSHLHRTD
jgi:hypothetical protein